MPKTAKRTTVDIPPALKRRIAAVGAANGKSLTIAAQAILEHSLPDFEEGRILIKTSVVIEPTPAETTP